MKFVLAVLVEAEFIKMNWTLKSCTPLPGPHFQLTKEDANGWMMGWSWSSSQAMIPTGLGMAKVKNSMLRVAP